ncbi:MAG: hypothetical protein IT364_09670 [Candidatus Hydrogenedentes bacterium]|nr:hypothetical protein [Candidatus Hydrogenedentota bacterium]
MNLPRVCVGSWRLRLAMLAAVGVACLPTPEIAAQNTDPPTQWTTVNHEAIWKQQVEDTTDRLGITGDDKSELSALYLAKRKVLQEQLDALDFRSPNSQNTYEDYRKLVETERDKFNAALTQVLDKEQALAVAGSLGSFSRQWDSLLAEWGALDLDPEKSKEGRRMIAAYIADWANLRGTSPANGDADSLRDEMDLLKVSLDLSLATLLTDEQQTEWQRRTQSGGQRLRAPGRRRR